MNKNINVEVSNSIGTVTINRPESLNSLDIDTARSFKVALQIVAMDAAVRAILIRSEGGYFMAGGDVDYMNKVAKDQSISNKRKAIQQMIDEVNLLIRAIRNAPKPVVACVQGGAAGVGISILSACDFAIGSQDGIFSMAYSNLGTTPDGGASYTLPKLVGLKRANELLMLSERFNAEQALQMGLLNKIVPTESLTEKTQAYLSKITSGPTHAYGNIKKLVNASQTNSLDEQLEMETRFFIDCAETNDFIEGVSAFNSKRKPNFKGN